MTAGEEAILDAQVERIRASRILDRSHSLSRLFHYLAEAARADRTLREIDVAQDVFGRTGDFSGDASVRVYIHRLRRKLAEFYAGKGAGEPHRLSVPLGEYRLVVGSSPEAAPPAPEARREKSRAAHRPRLWIWAAAAVVVLLIGANLIAWMTVSRELAPNRELARLSRTPLWSGIKGDHQVLVVIGDYYVFGERGDAPGLTRLIRDFGVNSIEDFDKTLMRRPELAQRYVAIDTYYTPAGAALALERVMPLVRYAAKDTRRVRVITSSQLTPEMLRDSDIVYIGYLSGLRLLEPPLFTRSRFQIGSTYDSLIDRETKQAYGSGAGFVRGDQPNEDFGYLATFEAPGGNRIVIIAGSRDIGVVQAAEVATDLAVQSSRPPLAAGASEWLYRVRGVGRTNFGAIPVSFGGKAEPSISADR